MVARFTIHLGKKNYLGSRELDKPEQTRQNRYDGCEKKYHRKADKPGVGRPAEVLGVRKQTPTAMDVAKRGGGGGGGGGGRDSQ